MIDHDRLFKELLTTFFVEFVELFLPDVSAYLDRDSLEFLDKEVFADVTAGERHEADLVVKAAFRGQGAFFLVHVENQAKAQEGFAKRMFRYFARLHEKHDLPVYPVAVLSYDTPLRAERDRYEVAFPGFVVNSFAFRVIQLNRLNWRDFVRKPNPVASALMAKMRIAPADRPRVKLECLRLLASLRLDPARMQLISGFVDTYLRLNTAEKRQFQAELDNAVPQEQKGAAMRIVTSWMRDGMEGIVLRVLRKRLGAISVRAEQRIDELSPEQLEELADAALDFAGAEDLDDWLDRNPPRE